MESRHRSPRPGQAGGVRPRLLPPAWAPSPSSPVPWPAGPAALTQPAQVIVDRAIYRDGMRAAEPVDLAEMRAACRAGGGLAWIGLYRPTVEEFAEVAEYFGLHELAVEDAVHAHQRPKLERYGDTLFCVLRPARYVDETETVEFGEVHVFAGPQFVITVRHSEAPDLRVVRHGLESRPDLLRRGTVAILHAIMDRVVDDYAPVVCGLENDIDEIEDEVFDGSPTVSRRIYDLAREVILFQRATKPLVGMLERLMEEPGVDDEERRYLRDVLDHALRVQEQVDGFRQLLQNILNVNLTLETKSLSEVSNAQNEEVKKISAWAAILFAPSMVGTIYGMNFDHMPELHWYLGYPFALGLMVAVCLALYLSFKRRRWI
jgi:magnesium transporter